MIAQVTPEFLPATEKALLEAVGEAADDTAGGHSNEHFALAHLLRDIPTADAEGLLVTHWERLRDLGLYIQAALYIDSEQTRALAH